MYIYIAFNNLRKYRYQYYSLRIYYQITCFRILDIGKLKRSY